MITKKDSFWILLSAVVLGTVVTLAEEYGYYSESSYQKRTPASVVAMHQKLAQELQTLHQGDFVEWGKKELAFAIREQQSDSQIELRSQKGWRGLYDIKDLSRRSPKITRTTDPNWPEVAKRFFSR